MIAVSHLSKTYGERRALDDVSFTVAQGEVVGFLGPNGAGKSTALRILAGFLPPTAGEVRLGGVDLFREARAARRLTGYVPEHTPLYPELPVRWYLDHMAALEGVPRGDRRRRVEEAMERCCLAEVAGTFIGKLSKGYRRRVGLAQALVHRPAVLLLDEPTEGLDPRQIVEARELIRELGRDHTVLVASHILAEVSLICRRAIIIQEGRIVAEDSLEHLGLSARPDQTLVRLEVRGPAAEVRSLLEGQTGVAEVRQETGEEPGVVRCLLVVEGRQDSLVREQVVRRVVEAGWEVRSLAAVVPDLEQAFLRLTGDGAA